MTIDTYIFYSDIHMVKYNYYPMKNVHLKQVGNNVTFV